MNKAGNYRMIEVNQKSLANTFLEFPVQLYKNDKNYIRPLNNDINDVFDKSKNKFFEDGECIRWLLYENNKVIGRVAAFYNKRNLKKEKQPTGGIGFFECVNDQVAANLLFDQCKTWLTSKGIEAMDGPVNFGERDKWWGLLVNGFLPPTFGMNYNPVYYRQLFENYGFKLYYKQYVFHRDLMLPPSERMNQKGAFALGNPDYEFRHFKSSESLKFVQDFNSIYNSTWTAYLDAPPMTMDQSLHIFKSLKPVLVDELLWFGYYKSQPISFFIMIPDVNIIIKDFNGRLNLLNKLKFVYRRHKGVRKVIGVIFGVTPAHQAKGIDQAMIVASGRVLQPKHFYTDIEMNWIGDFNPRMINVVRNIDSRLLKTYITYRLLFNPGQPFERHPIV